MAKVTIIEVHLLNFLSHKDSNVRLVDRGLILVEGFNRDRGGSNGAGKSAIVEAVTWCLTGYTLPRNDVPLKKDDICHKSGGDTEVTTKLIVDGANVVVSRYRNHSEHGNRLILVVDGKDISRPNDKATQEVLQQLIKLDWKSWVSTVLFPQGTKGFASLGDAEQKSIFQRLLGTARFSDAQANAKAKLKELETETTALVQHCNSLTTELEVHANTIGLVEGQITQWKEVQLVKIAELQSDLTTAQRQAKSSFNRPAAIAKLEDLQDEVKASAKPLDALELSLDQERKSLEAISFKFELAIKSSKVATQTIEKIANRDNSAIMQAEKNCPTCGQLYPEQARDHRLKVLLSESLEATNHLKKEQSHLQECESQLSAAAEERKGYEDRFEAFKQIREDYSQKTDSITKLELAIAADEEQTKTYIWTIQQLEKQLKAATQEINPHIETIAKTETLALVATECLEQAKADLDPLVEAQDSCRFWIAGFGNKGVVSLLYDTITPMLNSLANEYMDVLTSGYGRVEFSTMTMLASGEMRDKFSVKVSYKDGADRYAGVSGGECRRADIAIMLALADIASSRAVTSVDLRFLDEPFESLDSLGHEQVVNLLQNKVIPKVGTVFVMSHDDSLKQLIENRIEVVKTGGVSKIVDN